MTIEVERKFTNSDGLETASKRVVEYRKWERVIQNAPRSIHMSESNLPQNLFLLHTEPSKSGNILEMPQTVTFAHVITEDVVEIDEFNPNDLKSKNLKIYIREEINRANITDDKQEIRLIWRETKQGDYSEIPQGFTELPRQLKLNLR